MLGTAVDRQQQPAAAAAATAGGQSSWQLYDIPYYLDLGIQKYSIHILLQPTSLPEVSSSQRESKAAGM